MKPVSPTRIFAIAVAATASLLVFPGCSGEDPRIAPLKSEMELTVKAAIPAYLAMASIETEVIPTGENKVKINFKAKVKTMEELYSLDQNSNELRDMIVVKMSHASGSEANLYGSMVAERTLDKWTISEPTFDSGLRQLGIPKGSLTPTAVIAGSDEMKRMVAERAEMARQEKEMRQRGEAERLAQLEKSRRAEEESRLAKEEMRQKAEAERLAQLETQRAEQEELRKKLTEATSVGKRYQGILIESPGWHNESRQSIELKFTAQDGNLIMAEIQNPDNPDHQQTFSGELVIEKSPDARNTNERHYPIILSSKKTSAFVRDRSRLYFEQCVLRLDLSETGLEGEARSNVGSGSKFALRLQLAK